MSDYVANPNRYATMQYRRCGGIGIRLPLISLGLWQNCGGYAPFETARAMLHKAFDLGITHFDLANNYGPPYGSAEANLGRILKDDLATYRDALIISTKAGFDTWPGPYGDWGLANIWLPVWIKASNEWGLIMSIFSITIDLTLKPLWQRPCQP